MNHQLVLNSCNLLALEFHGHWTINVLYPIIPYLISEITPTDKEIESDTDATISCIVTGITKQLDAVVWTKGGTDVTTLTEDNSYVVSAGTYGSNSQTTTLTVKAAVNTADSTYTCVITSNEWLETDKETPVLLNVFGKFLFYTNVSVFLLSNESVATSQFNHFNVS